MFSLILIILASLIPFIVTWITSPEEIFLEINESKAKQIFKKDTSKQLSRKGKWFIVAIVLTCVFAFIQFFQNEKDKKVLNNERDFRDSIITAKINFGVDSNRKVLFKDLSEALANQNLKIDTVTKKLEILKDSARSKVMVFEGDAPLLNFCNQDGVSIKKIVQDTCVFLVKLCCENSGSRNVDLTLISLASPLEPSMSLNQLIPTGKTIFLSKNFSIPKSQSMNQEISISDQDIKKYKTFFFFMHGTYSNSTNTKTFSISSIVRYGMINNDFSFIATPYDEQIKLFLKNKGIY